MKGWLLCTLALLVGGMVPAAWLAVRGDPAQRLVGVALAGPVATLVLVLLAHAMAQPSYLIVALVLAPLSFAGTLVFTRLLGPRP
jgi:multisubunit Na+/H+ antiporter MnhF subunit